MRRLLIFALFAAVRAAAEVPVSPLTLTPTQPFSPPALATDGVNYLAVWSENRDPRRPAVYAARITPDRQLLDPLGVHLIDGIHAPAIAYGDGHYLVVTHALDYVVIDRDVHVLARGRIMPAGETVTMAEVLFNGREFVVFWGMNGVRSAIVDRDGRVLSGPTVVVPARDRQSAHAVATSGSRVFLTYARDGVLYVAATTPAGAPLWIDAEIARSVDDYARSSIASAGGTFVVTWQHRVSIDGFENTLHAAKLDASATILAGPRQIIPWPAYARVIAAGGGYRLFEAQELRVMSYELRGDLVTPAVVPAIDDKPPRAISGFAAAAGPGGTFIVAGIVHRHFAAGESALYAADGDVSAAPLLVSRAGTPQRAPSVAAGDDGLIVAWHEAVKPRVRAAFYGASHTSVFDVAAVWPDVSASVAAQGSAYLAVWQSTTGGVRGRVIRDGAPAGEELLIHEQATSPVAASDGRDFVVAAALPTRAIRLTRIDSDGAIVASADVPYQTIARPAEPALACDRGECLLAWAEQLPVIAGCVHFRCSYRERVVAVRLDASFGRIDETPMVLFDRGLAGTNNVIAAARDGSYAASWEINGVVYARAIERNGAPGAIHELRGANASMVHHAGAWLLAREDRDALALAWFAASDVHDVGRLAREGQSLRMPALALSGGRAMVAYERSTHGEAAGGAVRVYIETVGLPKRRAARH